MNNILKTAVDKFGADKQIDKAIEECAELIVSLMHYRFARENGSFRPVQEEIADVQLMCSQLAYIFGEPEIQNYKLEKLARLSRLLDVPVPPDAV